MPVSCTRFAEHMHVRAASVIAVVNGGGAPVVGVGDTCVLNMGDASVVDMGGASVVVVRDVSVSDMGDASERRPVCVAGVPPLACYCWHTTVGMLLLACYSMRCGRETRLHGSCLRRGFCCCNRADTHRAALIHCLGCC
eukprot:scaffold146699_cov17-Tisochrysis_lutea.AAC.1